MSIKYYHLAKDEEPPDEFCAVRDIGGEPSEYTFYAPEAENAKLMELTKEMFYSLLNVAGGRRIMTAGEAQNLMGRMRELGIEVEVSE